MSLKHPRNTNTKAGFQAIISQELVVSNIQILQSEILNFHGYFEAKEQDNGINAMHVSGYTGQKGTLR